MFFPVGGDASRLREPRMINNNMGAKRAMGMARSAGAFQDPGFQFLEFVVGTRVPTHAHREAEGGGGTSGGREEKWKTTRHTCECVARPYA